MTLKQERLIAGITNPQNAGKSLEKIAKESGYSDSYSTSLVYRDIRKDKIRERIADKFTAEMVKKDILKAEKDFTKGKDNSNRSRMIELRTRVAGIIKDSPQLPTLAILGDVEALLLSVKSDNKPNIEKAPASEVSTTTNIPQVAIPKEDTAKESQL